MYLIEINDKKILDKIKKKTNIKKSKIKGHGNNVYDLKIDKIDNKIIEILTNYFTNHFIDIIVMDTEVETISLLEYEDVLMIEKNVWKYIFENVYEDLSVEINSIIEKYKYFSMVGFINFRLKKYLKSISVFTDYLISETIVNKNMLLDINDEYFL